MRSQAAQAARVAYALKLKILTSLKTSFLLAVASVIIQPTLLKSQIRLLEQYAFQIFDFNNLADSNLRFEKSSMRLLAAHRRRIGN